MWIFVFRCASLALNFTSSFVYLSKRFLVRLFFSHCIASLSWMVKPAAYRTADEEVTATAVVDS